MRANNAFASLVGIADHVKTRKELPPATVPEHWSRNSWDEKAKENPLFAVMTTSNYAKSDSKTFTEEELEFFFAKGRRVYDRILKPRLSLCTTGAADPLVVEYGCGMGRILRAAVDDGRRPGGIDISPTMLDHCRRFVPESASELYALDSANRSGMPDNHADIVFSFAVFKHIPRLSIYLAALDEMARVLKTGGALLLNVNCQDFVHGSFENAGRTVNQEKKSLHYRHGERRQYKTHRNSTWSGVYIGYELLADRLAKNGVEILERFHHTLKKPQGIWIVGRKSIVP